MTALKRVINTGRQPIPSFSDSVTLIESDTFFLNDVFPAVDSAYNIACLALFNRRGALANATTNILLGYGYFGRVKGNGVGYVYGQDFMRIPSGTEYYSVSWLRVPPDAEEQATVLGPYPEQWFRALFKLRL